jgi:hypothetical protein
MLLRLNNGLIILLLIAAGAVGISAQTDASGNPFPPRGHDRSDEPKSVREMLAELQSAKRKREHEEMIKRGEQALELSARLDRSFESNQAVSAQTMKDLESLEKLVVRIRKDLGGDDGEGDDEKVSDNAAEDKIERPADVREGFKFLRSSTIKMVDELKKTTRFTISAAAIQTSNAVIRLARFLRLRN